MAMNFSSMNLKCENRALKSRLSKFESGQAYIDLESRKEAEKQRELREQKSAHKKEVKKLKDDHKFEIRQLKDRHELQLEQLSEQTKHLEEQHKNEIEKMSIQVTSRDQKIIDLKEQLNWSNKTIEVLRKSLFLCCSENEELIDDNEALRRKNEQLEQLIKEMEKSSQIKDEIIRRQNAIIEKDYTNSSIPSSRNPNHKAIHNGRVKTGRKPGGQEKHKGHCRPWYEANQQAVLAEPECVSQNPEGYVLQAETRSRKVVSMKVILTVTEYISRCWLDRKTGKKIWAEFPANCVNEVNYDETIKSFLSLLTDNANVSIRKAKALLRDISEGRLNLSAGMISNLRKEFSRKSKKEQDEIRHRLLTYPYMNIDVTHDRTEGKTGYIAINTNPTATLYTAGMHKGHELMDRTPANDYLNTVIQDGETTMDKYGEGHQQCLVHIQRYLRGITENEPDGKWAKQMLDLVQRMIDRHNEGNGFTEEEIVGYESEYDEIIKQAQSEYPQRPKGYEEGYTTYIRMDKKKDQFLYFLRHPEVPHHNNAAELCAREVKRKIKASDGFRSLKAKELFCNVKSVLVTARQNGINEYDLAKEIFARS